MNADISPLAADVIGIMGSVLFIIGYAYSNLTKAINQLVFNVLNLVGAVLLLTSLSVHFNLAAMLLEIAWGTIAILGIAKALWNRQRQKISLGFECSSPCSGDSPILWTDKIPARAQTLYNGRLRSALVSPRRGAAGANLWLNPPERFPARGRKSRGTRRNTDRGKDGHGRQPRQAGQTNF